MQNVWRGAGRSVAQIAPLVPMVGIIVLLPVVLILHASHLQWALIALALVGLFVAVFGLERMGTAVLILAFATVPWNAVYSIGHASYLLLSNVLLVVGVLMLLGGRAGRRVTMPLLFTSASVGLTVVCITAAATHPGELVVTFDTFLGVIIVPMVIVWWRPTERVVASAAVAYIVGNAISIGDALSSASGNANRQAGLSTHPNALGVCCALALALMPFLWQATTSNFYRGLLVAGGLFTLYGVDVSGSRAALVCVVVLTILVPILARSTKAGLGVAALSVPALIIVSQAAAHPSSTNALGRLLGGGDVSGSNDLRATGAQEAVAAIRHHPFLGVGWTHVWGAHNIYLQTAAAVGVVGLALLVLILISALAPLISVPGRYRLLAYPALGAVLVGFVDPDLGARYIWAPLALSFCASRLAREDGSLPLDLMVPQLADLPQLVDGSAARGPGSAIANNLTRPRV